jgi:hypothetical protein
LTSIEIFGQITVLLNFLNDVPGGRLTAAMHNLNDDAADSRLMLRDLWMEKKLQQLGPTADRDS